MPYLMLQRTTPQTLVTATSTQLSVPTGVGGFTYNTDSSVYTLSGPAGATDTITLWEEGMYLARVYAEFGGAAGAYDKSLQLFGGALTGAANSQQARDIRNDASEIQLQAAIHVDLTEAMIVAGQNTIFAMGLQASGANRSIAFLQLSVIQLSPVAS